MVLKKQSLLSQKDLVQTPRLSPNPGGGSKRVKLAASAGLELLPVGCPLAFNSSTSLWQPWTQPSDAAVYTITADAIPATAGTFDLVIDGLVIEAVFDVTAAALQAAVNAVLVDAEKGWAIAAAATTGVDLGDANAVITITFDEAAGAPSVALDVGDLTGNAHVLAATGAGTQLNGTDKISGFILEANSADQAANGDEGVLLDATLEVLGMALHMGEVYRDDVNTAAIRTVLALFGAPSEAEMDAALRDPGLRKDGIVVRGLTGVR